MTFSPTFEQEFSESFAKGFLSRDKRPLDEWAPDNITVGSWSPWPGKLSFDHTPMLIPPMRALGRPTCHRMTIVAAAAGGKSTIAETFAAKAIVNDPGFMCWFSQTEVTAKEFAETRIWPFLENCPGVVKLLPPDRHKRRTCSIIFPHMSFLILPANTSSAQSKHIRYLICDETWLYEPGMLAQLHKRTTKFAHNRKILELSTGSILGDETDQAYNAGTRREWQFCCPKCSNLHVPFFSPEKPDAPGGVRWNKDAKLDGGAYNFARVRETCRYQCPNCLEEFVPSDENQYRLNRNGCYTGPEGEFAHESYHWAAWSSDFRLIGDFAVEFLQAKAAIRRGSLELLQEFTQKREAKAWDASIVDAEPEVIREATYFMGEDWPERTHRFLTIDVQKFNLWAVVRDWAPGPKTRLVWAGKINTWDEARSKQIQFGIPDAFVFADSGFFTEVVYGQCCRWDWNAIKGEKAANGFIYRGENDIDLSVPVIEANTLGQPTQLPPDAQYSSCNLYRVSEEMTAETLHLFRTGRALGWEKPRDPPEEYEAQMTAKIRRARQHKTTGQTIWEWVTVGIQGEHLWDCERMQIAAAFLAELLEGKPVKKLEQK